MSDEKEKPEIKIDGTRVVCRDHGIRGIKGCCGENPEPVKAADDGETGFDLVEAIADLVDEPLSAADYNELFFARGAYLPIVIDEAANDFDWDKVAEEITGSLSRKMAVLQTSKGPNWFKDYLESIDREFLYGPGGKAGPEPIGLLRAHSAGPSRGGPEPLDPDPEC